jgi:hypothetical protein
LENHRALSLFRALDESDPSLSRRLRSNSNLSRFSFPKAQKFCPQNCVDNTGNRTQYLVVVTLLPLEMGNGFRFKGKIVEEEFHASKEKGSEKEKETLITSEIIFSLKKSHRPLGRSTFRGVFCCRASFDNRHERAVTENLGCS